MIRLNRLQHYKDKWRINRVALPDEKDYILIFKCNTIEDCIEYTGLHRQSVYDRIHSLSKNILPDQYKDLPPKVKLQLLAIEKNTIKLLMMSVILGIISNPDIINDITKRFIGCLNGNLEK
jgi:hypothetical protein